MYADVLVAWSWAPAMSWIETAIGAGLGVAGGIFSASQANRFAERMSSTAHQREVADLRKAGLNPMLSVNRGASTPSPTSSDVAGSGQRGASTALAVRQQRAAIELMSAQADAAGAAAGLSRTQAADISTTWASGRGAALASSAELLKMDVEQRKKLFPVALERAIEEVRLTSSSVEQAKARTELLELAKEGAVNIAEWEKRVGESGPAVKFFIELVRLMGLSRGITP